MGAKLKNEGKELGEGILITGHWQSFSSHTGRITAKRLPLTSMPVSMRDFVVAPEGFNIMSLDMANAELRFLAHHAQCKSLIEKFNNGEDIHQETAGLIKKEISSGYVVDDETARELAKRYTYSLLYGASVRTVTDNLQKILPQVMTLNVVNINEAFKQRYPELDDFLVARERSTKLLTPFGEVEPIASFNRMQKRNFTLQSSVSVAIKLLMKIISDLNATVVHVLHDEVWILVPNGYSTETLIETITKDFKEEIQKVFPGFPNVNLLACEKIGGRNNGK